MDLCCLIDSEDRLTASDLVTMVGGLLERGVPERVPLSMLYTNLTLSYFRNKISRKTTSARSNTDR